MRICEIVQEIEFEPTRDELRGIEDDKKVKLKNRPPARELSFIVPGNDSTYPAL